LDSQDSHFKYVLDAGAFYTGLVFLSSAYQYWTTQAIFDEVKHIKRSHGAIEALLESNTLQVLNSDRKNIDKVVAAARRTGDYQKLSEADISIIALASKGITHTRRWIAYCSACGKAFGPNAKECRLCGNRLRRKYKSK
jgi:UPF0271 protein